MIKTSEELNLIVRCYRLMTLEELEKFEEQIPETDSDNKWWLADVDPDDDNYAACAEGNCECNETYVKIDKVNVYIRPVLEIEGTGIKSGDEFVYKGLVFTALDETLAISNNLLGCAKYYDDELAKHWYYDMEFESPTDTIMDVLRTILD